MNKHVKHNLFLLAIAFTEISELAKLGVANIRRAYGNWKKDGLKGWEAVLHEYAIRPVQ